MTTDNPLIDKALEKIAAHTAEVVRLKRFINQADKLADELPRFPEVDEEGTHDTLPQSSPVSRKGKKWNPGDFFNESLAGAVRRILIARKETAGGPNPASVDDIHSALSEGSFNFDSTSTDAQKAGIRISLGKNSVAFVKLPNSDLFGLIEWYGQRKGKPGPKKTATNGGTSTSTTAGEEAAGDAAADPQQDEKSEGQ